MLFPNHSSDIPSIIRKYRVHLFVFFLALFIGLTLAHPAILLNDEFITANQLRQLHAGHQIIINEGKYGSANETGGMSGYFFYKSNILAYTLFLPLISMPAFWAIDIFSEQVGYLVLVLWTITALILLLFINRFFQDFSFIGRWQWTSPAAGLIFLVFFINLYYYSSFSVDPLYNYPEILAIVFTNIILLALSGMLIYEINRTIFEDPAFSFFGTMVCLFSSSYFLWSTYCKDHILVLACFVPIVLSLVRFVRTDEYWYLPLAFLFAGLMAWARPEIALWIFMVICGICGYTLFRFRRTDRPGYHPLAVLCSPLFTLVGALPFFFNNLLMTKNFLLPVSSLYLRDESTSVAMNSSQSLMTSTGVSSLQSVLTMFLPKIQNSPLETLGDIVRIFFIPQTGHMGVFTIVPLFLVMLIFAGILFIFKKFRFTPEEKKYVTLLSLISAAVFLTYANQIHILNTDPGITPDIRYLSPLYFCLSLVGLIILKKSNLLPAGMVQNIKQLFTITLVGAPLSVIALSFAYTLDPKNLGTGNIAFEKFFTLFIFSLIILTLIVLFYGSYCHWDRQLYSYPILLLCSIPFFWQVNATFVYRAFSGFAGHIFWIPVVRVFWDLIMFYLFLK